MQHPTGHDASVPRVPALDALLRDLGALRLSLETDLTLVAAAVEAGAPELAAELLEGDRRDLHELESRALGHLRALDDLSGTPRRRRSRRLTRLVPVAPLVAAAAALVGLLGGVPGTGGRSDSGPDVTSAALSSWQELDRLSRTDASPADLAEAAARVNADVATLLARSAGDPAAARQALAILRGTQRALADDADAAPLQAVLAQSQALAARLSAALPDARAASAPLRVTPSDVVRTLPTARPSVAVTLPPPSRRPAPAASAPARPAARPTPSASPSRTPQPAPTPAQGTDQEPAPTLLPGDLQGHL